MEEQKRKSGKGSTILAVGIAVGMTALGGGLGFALWGNSDDDKPVKPVVVNVDDDDIVEVPGFDYGPWNDLNDYFDYNNVGMLGHDRYTFRTSELCVNAHKWRKPSLAKGETEAYVFATPELVIRTEHPSNPDSFIVNGLCYGVKLRVLEIYDDNYAKVEYLEGETRHPIEDDLVGYVSTEFIASATNFDLMSRYVLTDESAQKSFSVSKWRLAAADVMYAVGATRAKANVSIAVDKVVVVKSDKESVVVFGIKRDDSDVKLLAVVEFFGADNEYRILGIIPGEKVEDVRFYSTGDYAVIYNTIKPRK